MTSPMTTRPQVRKPSLCDKIGSTRLDGEEETQGSAKPLCADAISAPASKQILSYILPIVSRFSK